MVVCDIAWELGLSESEFYDKYDSYDRAQLIATYRSKNDRAWVMNAFPIKQRKG